MPLTEIEAKPVELRRPNEVYVALWHGSDYCWQVSGVLYRTIDEIEANLAGFAPVKILVFRVALE